MEASAKIKLCQENVAGWENIPVADIEVTNISGGLTNVLSKATITSLQPAGIIQHVLIREFGVGSELFIDHEAENSVFKELSEKGVGPRYYGGNKVARVEEFLQGSSLSVNDLRLPHVVQKVAQSLARFHTIKLKCITPPTEATAISNLTNWWQEATRVSSSQGRHALRLAALELGKLFHEVTFLANKIRKLESPLCFCHNDVQEGNIMMTSTSEEEQDAVARLIDFDYASYNFIGYDIGNLFCELSIDNGLRKYPGFCYNADKFPDLAQRRRIIETYLQSSGKPISACEVDRIEAESRIGALTSHLQWGLWGIVQSEHSTIDFGYLEYATMRIDAYFAMKREWGFDGYAAQHDSHLKLHLKFSHTHF